MNDLKNLYIITIGYESTSTAAAGYFGDGVKAEINCLLRAGASVEYRTGNVLWTFQYLCASGHEQRELHIISSRQSDASCGNITMTISVPAKSRQKAPSLNLRSYLFFQGSYSALTWPVSSRAREVKVRHSGISGLEILPDPEHHGRVFVHGMPVMHKKTSLKGFGLNYLGEPLSIQGSQDPSGRCHALPVLSTLPQVHRCISHSA